MNEQTERRLKRLVGPEYDTDPVYHAMVNAFRSWLISAEMAMQDEGVSNTTVERVLNRMVYATPWGPSDRPEMMTIRRSVLEDLVMRQDPRLRVRTPGPNAPGHRDVFDLYNKGPHGPHPT